MTIESLAADIARRVPEMYRDSAANNADLIASLIREREKLNQTAASNPLCGVVQRAGHLNGDCSLAPTLTIAVDSESLQKFPANLLYKKVSIQLQNS
jgi:hypothetical protein